MRINLFITFIASAIMCSKIAATITVVNMERSYWLYFFPAIFFLLFIIYKRINILKNTIVQIGIGISTSLIYIAFSAFLFLCFIGFPPHGEFEEKNKSYIVSEHEINAGNQLYKILEEFDRKLSLDEKEFIDMVTNNEGEFNRAKITEILDRTVEERRKIAELVKLNNIANPTHPYQRVEDSLNGRNSNNKFRVFSTLFRLELLEVQALHTEELYIKASEEYVLLWYQLNNILKIKNADLVDALVFTRILEDLGKYYYDNQSMFDNDDLSKISSIEKQIIPGLDKLYEIAFSKEYNFFKNLILRSNNTWPFIDKNKFLFEMDTFFYTMSELTKRPHNNKLIIAEEPISTKDLAELYLIKNPVGEVLYSVTYHMFSELTTSIASRKNKIAVYLYAIDYRNNPDDIPIDYFTGQKVKIEDFPDHIEIEAKMSYNTETEKFIIQK